MSARKRLRWIAWAAAALCAMLVGAVLIAPSLIDTRAIRGTVVRLLEVQTGGKVEIQQQALEIFPMPRLSLHGVKISLPEAGRLEVAVVDVYPRIGSLLTGRLQIAHLRLETPDIRLKWRKAANEESTAPQAGWSGAARLLSDLEAQVPKIKVEIDGGRLTLTSDGEPATVIEEIEAMLLGPPGKMKVELSCRSNLWQQAALQASLDASTGTGKGGVQIKGATPVKLFPLLFPASRIPIREAVVDLDAEFYRTADGRLSVSWTGRLPILSIHLEGGEDTVFHVKRLDGEVAKAGEDLSLTVSGLEMVEPDLSLSARLRLAPASPRIAIDATVGEVELSALRKTVLALFGDLPEVTAVTDVVRSGTAPETTLRLQGDVPAELGRFENFSLQGSLANGTVWVPDLDLTLNQATGEVSIDQTVLSCRNVVAVVGKNRLTQGAMTLGLAGGDAPFHLEADVVADLRELPAILKKTVADRQVLDQIDRVDAIDGAAQGKLTLGERKQNVTVAINVDQVQATLRHRSVPFPIGLNGGPLSIRGNRVQMQHLAGSLGNSSFNDLSGQVHLITSIPAELKVKNLKIDLSEKLEWLKSDHRFKETLSDVKSADGLAELSDASLSGPITDPTRWKAQANGVMNDVKIDSALFPSPLTVRRSEFKAATENGRHTLTMSHTRGRLMDADFESRGVLSFSVDNPVEADIYFAAQMQTESVEYLSRRLHTPTITQLKSPLSISDGHLQWSPNVYSADVTLQTENAATAVLQIKRSPDSWHIQAEMTKEDVNLFDLALGIGDDSAELAFNGELDRTVIEQFAETTGFPRGRMKGDFKARIRLDRPLSSTATGRLEVSDLVFPWDLATPIRIHRAMLAGHGNRLSIEAAELIWGDEHLALQGDIGFSQPGLQLDLKMTGDGLDLNALAGDDSPTPDPGSQTAADAKSDTDDQVGNQTTEFEDLPFSGKLAIDLGQLVVDRFTWKPFRADATFKPGHADVSIIDAVLCNISMPGRVSFEPGAIIFDVAATAEKKPLEGSLDCLLGPDFKATGTFDLSGKFQAQGRAADLPRVVEGKVEFHSEDGRIYKDFLFRSILSFLSITEVFVGRLPDMGKEGLLYYKMDGSAEVKNGKLLLSRGVFDGSALHVALSGELDYINETIDFKGLAAPLKVVRRVVDMIPLIGTPLANRFTTIPFKATGKWQDPKVETTFISSIAPGLVSALEELGRQPAKLKDAETVRRD